MQLPKLRHLSLFLIIALFLAIWIGRAQLSEFVISSSLQGLGLNKVTTDINHLGLGQSHISRFGFTLATETGLFMLEAHDISIQYNPEQLAQSRVESLAIDRLIVNYADTRMPADKPAATPQAIEPLILIATLREALRKYVIFDSFLVDYVILQGESFEILQGHSFKLSGTNKDGLTYAELTLHDSGQADNSSQLVITGLSEQAVTAELRLTKTPELLPARLALIINDSNIEGRYILNPHLVSNWLQPIIAISGINKAGKIEGTLAFDFKSSDQIESVLTAAIDKLTIAPYLAENVYINLELHNAHSNPFQSVKIHGNSFIKADTFRSDNFSLEDSKINLLGDLSRSSNGWQYKGDLSSSKLAVNYESRRVQFKDIAAGISAGAENLKLDGGFSTADIPAAFGFILEHDFNKARGWLSIKPLKPLDLNTENNKLSLLLTPWPYPFDLLGGNIKLTTDARWSQGNDFSLTSRINLDDAGGNYGDLVFSGLSFDHAFEILPNIHSIQTSKINLKQLDSGVTASNISTSLTLETADTGTLPQLAIQGLHGEIFDGTFSADNFVFDLNRSKNSFKIKTTDIDLAKIVETQQLEDIVVTGRIDGTIPVEINEQGIFIQHGAFVNDIRAGTIRYNPAAGTDQLKQNPITGIALDALKDFRYTHLSADVNFTPEGMLTINLQLKGTSPELDTKRPVHLNINTEQNLLSLLKSLRYAQGVSESIDQKVRRQYEKNQKQ